jgi:hypothetical protein
MHAFHFGTAQRRLFGAFHPAQGTTRGLVLLCPPLLHEHMRSYRFFSQMADRLAEAGLACLRFDYFGTGDSGGDDADFSPADAPGDIALAIGELRRRGGAYFPLMLLGIRASALFAARAAQAAQVDALWLWLPVTDGRAYVETLDARYGQELASPDRYPMGHGSASVGPNDLLGFSLSPAFRNELAGYRIDPGMPLPPTTVVCAAGDGVPVVAAAIHHVLPDKASCWADEIDLRNLILVRDIEPVLHALLDELPQAPRQVANV